MSQHFGMDCVECVLEGQHEAAAIYDVGANVPI